MSFKNLEKFKSDSYKKNENLENLLSELNHYLGVISKNASEKNPNVTRTTHPLIFIVGVPRSGTTLLSQWLAATNEFCYPSNFISRFFEAPFFGGLIQEMIFNEKYSYKNELHIAGDDISFSSDVGKTKGALEPHEFWYFWRRFFDFPDIPVDNTSFESKADFTSFINELYRFQCVFNKPLFIKSLIINPYILPFYKRIPNALFLHIKREPLANMQSLLKIREKYYGDKEKWFSFKPNEFDLLKHRKPEEQVAGQVFYINRNIENQFKNIDENNRLSISYDEFCKSPSSYYKILSKKLNNLGFGLDEDYKLGKSFIVKEKNSEDQLDGLLDSWNLIKRLEN